MKNLIAIISLALFVIIGCTVYFFKSQSDSNNNNYSTEKTSAKNQEQLKDQSSENQTNNNSDFSAKVPIEGEELASFSTKIYTKDSNRQNNISITCSRLNDLDIANGETFSFCNTVGRSSPNKGYKKADIFANGKKIKGYGGGNCQISTTLYNAVLAVPSLQVTERHEHSNKVSYIQNGKDAAVSFGSYDFKFVNNTGNNIRIKAINSPDEVTIKIIKLI